MDSQRSSVVCGVGCCAQSCFCSYCFHLYKLSYSHHFQIAYIVSVTGRQEGLLLTTPLDDYSRRPTSGDRRQTTTTNDNRRR